MPPRRAGRRPQPLGRQGLSHHRGMVGGTLGLLRQPWGVSVAWAWATATVPDQTLPWRMRPGAAPRMVLRDPACHAAEGEPTPLTLWQRGAWPDRLLVETGLAMLPVVCHGQRVRHRGWPYGHARLAFTMAALHVLVQGHGFQPSASGCVPLSLAEWSLEETNIIG